MASFGNNFNSTTNKSQEDDLGNRKERLLKVATFLKRIDSENKVEDVKEKNEFIQNISFDQFQSLLLRINGILRNIPIKKRSFHATPEAGIINLRKDGKVTYVTPPNSEKIHLLEESLDALKRMTLSNRNVEAAMMLGTVINAIHPFEDGNGRTARIVSSLLASSKERFLTTAVDPESIQSFIEAYITEHVYPFKEVDILGIENAYEVYPNEISDKEKYELGIAEQDDTYNLIKACRILMQRSGGGSNFESSFISPDTKVFSLKEFFLRNKDKISMLLKTYYELKNKYVEVLIDVFENPQKYKVEELGVYKTLPEARKRAFAGMNIVDFFYINLQKDSFMDDEFSWDYLVNFIKQQKTE